LSAERVWTWAAWAASERPVEAFEALLFDLDGTLVDTLPVHHRAYAEVFAAQGLQLSFEQYRANAAAPARISIPRFLLAAGADPAAFDVGVIHAAKKARLAELMERTSVLQLPAAAILRLHAGRLPLGLVTSAARAGAELILRSQGWSNVFQAVVTGDDVGRGKPHPEPYLAAAAALRVRPETCLVFEDAPEGIEAALAAGAAVVDVREAVLSSAAE
jgi:HAD superfamily hydrolase (TIGR01509 family)